MELNTAALVAMFAAGAVVLIGSLTGAIGQPAPHLRPATRPGTPRPPHPVQRRAELHHPSRPAAPAATRTPRPAASPSVESPSPAAVVAAYYAALDARRFDAAWRVLGGGVRSSFGGFTAWRDGFATTVSSRPREVRVARAGRHAVVTLLLAATDRSPGGLVRRRFAVRWELAAGPAGWVASAVSATRG